MSKRKRVVVVGGGAGGLIVANSLAARDDYEVTLVNDTPYHHYWPQLLQIAFRGDDSQLRRRIETLVKRGVNLLIDAAEAVDLNERVVVTSAGRRLQYDFVVLAPGLTIDHGAIKGNDKLVELFGDFHSTPENAWKVFSTITSIRKGRFVVAVADPGHRCPPS